MLADGTNLTRVGYGWGPAYFPDGSTWCGSEATTR